MDLLEALAGFATTSLDLLLARGLPSFQLSLIVGAALAAACWIGCFLSVRLWNRQYRLPRVYHVLCGTGALLILAASVVLPALNFAEATSEVVLEAWQNHVTEDAAWQGRALAEAYEAVRLLGVENTSGTAGSETTQSVSATSPVSVEEAAGVFARRAVAHLEENQPLLAFLVDIQSDRLTDLIQEDVRHHLIEVSDRLPPARAISLAVAQIESQLTEVIPSKIFRARVLTISIVLLVQALLFGSAAWLAYRDIRVRV